MRKIAVSVLLFVSCIDLLFAQDNTFRIQVLAYQWTTTRRTLTFSWPGYANTSCSGTSYVNGYASGSSIYANGTSSDTCSTTYTPPTNQSIDILKPVVYILADSATSRMMLTCTRNVRWSQCHALNPGAFLARTDHGHFEVQGVSTKGKEEWVKFDIVQQTSISSPQFSNASESQPSGDPCSRLPEGANGCKDGKSIAQTAPREAPSSIESPGADATGANSGFPSRWKSMTTGTLRTLRFEGDYIYAESVLSEAMVKAGAFFLMDLRKNGEKYVGTQSGKVVRPDGGASCPVTWPVELTLVTPSRIEGRGFAPPATAKVDWTTCTISPSPDWQSFTWIPVK